MEVAGAIEGRIVRLVVGSFLVGLLDALLLEGRVVLMMMVMMAGRLSLMMKSSSQVRVIWKVIWKVILSFCHPRMSLQVSA